MSAPDHPLADGLPATWPEILGYNRLTLRPEAVAVAMAGDDPLLVGWNFGRVDRSLLPPIADPIGRHRHLSSG